jgi:hypothetical protein
MASRITRSVPVAISDVLDGHVRLGRSPRSTSLGGEGLGESCSRSRR